MSVDTETVTTPKSKEVVRKIKELDWEHLNAEELVVVWYLSYVAAVEFAEALRIALADVSGRRRPQADGLR